MKLLKTQQDNIMKTKTFRQFLKETENKQIIDFIFDNGHS